MIKHLQTTVRYFESSYSSCPPADLSQRKSME